VHREDSPHRDRVGDFIFYGVGRSPHWAGDHRSWLGGGSASKNNFTADGGVESSREEDIKLMRAQRIRYICDLMVEDRKRKYGLYVSSSEKTDRFQRYADFCISAIPFPGTEFFSSWQKRAYPSAMPVDWSEFGTESTNVVLDPEAPIPFDTRTWRHWNIGMCLSHFRALLSF